MNKASKVAVEKRPFCKRLLSLTGKFNAWELWSDFITMLAIAISNSVDKARVEKREAMYAHITSKYSAQDMAVFQQLVCDAVEALEVNPEQDFLGSAYMELDMGNDHAGQFFTPYDVCRCMASISMLDVVERIKRDGYITINDPACGAGATLIAAVHEVGRKLHATGDARNWQRHVLVFAQDIDFTVGMMCYIQLSLLGVAACIKIGNTLTDPMCRCDSTEYYWFTPMYFSDVWQMRFLWRRVDALFSDERKDETNGQ